MKKIGISKIVFVIILLSMFVSAEKIEDSSISNVDSVKTLNIVLTFPPPTIVEYNDYIKIDVDGVNSYLTIPGEPLLPVYSTLLKFPLGTRIINFSYTCSKIENIFLSKKPLSTPQPIWLKDNNIFSKKINFHDMSRYNSTKWYYYRINSGLDNSSHITFLSIKLFPVTYSSDGNILRFVRYAKIKIIYSIPSKTLSYNNDEYKLVIIAPSSFSKPLYKLIDHKVNTGIKTKLVTLDEIYNGIYFPVEGRDDAEKIKYFIKNTVEQWGVKYVLLVGNVDKLPMRKTWFWDGYFITDLYYADLYNANGTFSSWDTNNNGFYGEYLHNGNTDSMDIYPDVYLGRLACNSISEVKVVVDKIINYENKASDDWFKKIILCGGDTFPNEDGLEGEYMNQLVAENMSGFTPIKLWVSKGNLDAKSIIEEIDNGAGFIHFSGHGSPFGWATHPYNDYGWINFNLPHILFLSNGYKLPIVFLDACSTAELDIYLIRIGDIVTKMFPCFAWSIISHPNGGAVASIGSTRVAYTLLTKGGAGYLGLHFFLAYRENITLAEMFVQAQNDYMNNLWVDGYTLEEFILLGDPSLRVGGIS